MPGHEDVGPLNRTMLTLIPLVHRLIEYDPTRSDLAVLLSAAIKFVVLVDRKVEGSRPDDKI
jgi:hypothetical protein